MLPHPVAVAPDVDDVAMVQQPVDERRRHDLVSKHVSRAALHLFIDSTGLSMVGEGEWAAVKHGRRGRRGWKKLHLGVDQAGVIVAQALTDSAVDDASTGIGLIETVASSARMITADAVYDTLAFYETANTRGTTVVVPPAKTATLSQRNPRSSARDRTIRKISRIGRRRWKKGGRLSSTGPRRERVLPVQVDSRRSTSKSDSRSASCRIGACVQCAQSNDRAWSTRVVRDRSVTNLRVGALGASFDLRNNALTNLYNTRPQWLVDAHAVLDAAVARAYGWPIDISNDDALRELLKLNGGC